MTTMHVEAAHEPHRSFTVLFSYFRKRMGLDLHQGWKA